VSGIRPAVQRSPLAALNGENSRAKVQNVREDSSVIFRIGGMPVHPAPTQLVAFDDPQFPTEWMLTEHGGGRVALADERPVGAGNRWSD
jgi:hypothetical protein